MCLFLVLGVSLVLDFMSPAKPTPSLPATGFPIGQNIRMEIIRHTGPVARRDDMYKYGGSMHCASIHGARSWVQSFDECI
jgi:hypothetical protein